MLSLNDKLIAPPAAPPAESTQRPVLPARLVSLDAYRGLVMLLMMAEVLRLKMVAQALPQSSGWRFLAWFQTHVAWTGATLHDFIQPSFSFLVGANSIAAYVIAHVCEPFIAKSLLTHLGAGVFRSFGPAYQPLILGIATLFVMWLLLCWMWRRKLFLKV